MRYEIAALTMMLFAFMVGRIYGRCFDFSDTTDEHSAGYLFLALIVALTTMLSILSVPVLVVWGILS